MEDFSGKIAVVTGAGSGIGRELALQLAAAGAHVAMCDVNEENLAQSKALCEQAAPPGGRITTHVCDVSDESQVMDFAEQVLAQHRSKSINLLFNNAGIGGGGSFVAGDRSEWERVYSVCWQGVYFCCRAFVPLLLASSEGHVINVSSVNGFWASVGPHVAHTAYSAAKFAVKGFSEALLQDLRLHAPHVKLSLVMPGHIGTSIVSNSRQVLGGEDSLEMGVEAIDKLRGEWTRLTPEAEQLTDEEVRQLVHSQSEQFRDNAPTSSSDAATIILDGVRANQWRILVGDDASGLDSMVRQDPENAYEPDFYAELVSSGAFSGVGG